MYMQAVTYRIVYVGMLSVGLLFGAAFRQSTVHAAPAADTQVQAVAAAKELPIVTLPAVQVRASARNAAVAKAAPKPAAAERITYVERDAGSRAASNAGASLPSLRLDMPYYTFGKLLPRVGKE